MYIFTFESVQRLIRLSADERMKTNHLRIPTNLNAAESSNPGSEGDQSTRHKPGHTHILSSTGGNVTNATWQAAVGTQHWKHRTYIVNTQH